MITAMPSIPIRRRRIESGSISLSFFSAVVTFVEVLLTNVDCVESDRTVTLLKSYKAESKLIYLLNNVPNANYSFEHFLKLYLFD